MSAPENTPFDPGVQLERTALAWRRSVLALAVASLASVQVLFGVFGYGAVAVAAVGLAVAALLRLLSGLRYRRAHRALSRSASGERPRLPGAAPLALCAACVVAAGLVSLAYVALGVLR